MTRNQWQEVTDNPYSKKFLVYIYEHGRIMKSELQQFTNSQTLIQTVDFLEELGLIECIKLRAPKRRTDIVLTPKGERAARRFIELVEDLPEDDHIPSPPPEQRVSTKEE